MSAHGTRSRYTNGGCRCDQCRAANTEAVNAARARRQAWLAAAPDHIHGTENGYNNYRCRCDSCKDAHRRNSNAINARNREMRNWSRS